MAARVLIVDDEELLRCALVERLRAEGHTVVAVANGHGVEAEAEQADLILIDRHLPDADGLAIAERLRQEQPSRGVILMTAYNTFEIAERAADTGVHHVLVKPFDLDDVARVVRDALALARPLPWSRRMSREET